jgi:hypothetical protein
MVKRMLLVVAAALMLFNTLAIPTLAHADGEPSCTGNCKP